MGCLPTLLQTFPPYLSVVFPEINGDIYKTRCTKEYNCINSSIASKYLTTFKVVTQLMKSHRKNAKRVTKTTIKNENKKEFKKCS